MPMTRLRRVAMTQDAIESRVARGMETPALVLPAAERLELALREFSADILKRRAAARAQQRGRRRAGQHRGLAMPHPVAALARAGQRHEALP